MLAIYTVAHQASDPSGNIWNETVREYPWFADRSTLSSAPPSPTVERPPRLLSLKLSLKHPRPRAAFNPSDLAREKSPFDDPVDPILPVSTFDRVPEPSYQPAQRSYEGLHFATMRDPPPIIDTSFTRPRGAPQPPVRAQSLYPVHMQAQLPIDARDNMYRQSSLLEGMEPSPIGDWPRKSRNNGYGRRQPQANTKASASTQQPLSSTSSDQRLGLSGTTNASSPLSQKLGSPVRGPRRNNSIRKLPPPPLNLDGISNSSSHARR